jgi:uncharacterized protein DUF4019
MNAWQRLAAAALTAFAAGAWAQEEVDVRPATDAADAWLAMVDGGRYGESWETAATTFKEAITRVKWETTIQDVRAPLGVVVRRKVRIARHVRDEPGTPGEYVVIQHDTVFEKRPLTSETVSLMKQRDGTWKVAGYFIK